MFSTLFLLHTFLYEIKDLLLINIVLGVYFTWMKDLMLKNNPCLHGCCAAMTMFYKKTCFSAKNEPFLKVQKHTPKNKELLKLLYHVFGKVLVALVDVNTPFTHV